MSNQSQLREPTEQTDRLAGSSATDAENEQRTQLSVGTYFTKAGTRDAGGVVMYAQELIDAVADEHPAYLYTEAGELTPKMQATDAEVVQMSSAPELLSGLSERLPNPDSALWSLVAEKLLPLSRAVRDGTVRHMNEQLDVLVTHDFLDDIVLSNLLDIPVVRVFHGFERTGLGTKAHGLLASSHSIANSAQTRAEFAEHLDAEPDGIVSPGVNLDSFHPDAKPAFEDDAWTMLFVGRFVASKGIFDLLDATADLPDDVHLLIVGRGDADALRERIESNGLESNVTIEGAVSHDDLPGYYRSADMLCAPSHYESFGMVNVEAMACGTPIVTTDVEGIAEYAIDRETAMVVPPNAPSELADAIATLRSSSELQTRLAEQGRATATRYSWEASAASLVEMCLEIVGEE